MTKTCNLCKLDKNIDEYDKDSSIKSGYRGRCKPCRTIVERERRAAKRAGTDTKVASKHAANLVTDNEVEKQRRLISEANQGAIKRLLRAHEDEFKRFVEEERVRLGVAPKWTSLTR